MYARAEVASAADSGHRSDLLTPKKQQILKRYSIPQAGTIFAKDNFCQVNLQPKRGRVVLESEEEEEDEGSKSSGGGVSQNLRMLRKREALMAAKAAEAREKNAGQCGSVYDKTFLSTYRRTIPNGEKPHR